MSEPRTGSRQVGGRTGHEVATSPGSGPGRRPRARTHAASHATPTDPTFTESGPLELSVHEVHVEGRRSPMLDLDDLRLSTGECVLVAGEPGQGHTALALVATGRLAPFSGSVELTGPDGSTTDARDVLRTTSAVVDLPGVSAPDDTLLVATVAGEGLALAHRRSGPSHVRRWLEDNELLAYADVRMDELPGIVRTVLLTSLALERRRVRFVVMSLPDRHGGEPAAWWSVAQAVAARGYGVLVQCSRPSARDLGATLEPARGDTSQRATPIESLRAGSAQTGARGDAPELTVYLDDAAPDARAAPDTRAAP